MTVLGRLGRLLRPRPEQSAAPGADSVSASSKGLARSVGVVISAGPRQGRYLSECLESLAPIRPQHVVVVPWGAGEVANRDVRVLPAVASAPQARAAGLDSLAPEAAYVVFLDASETIDPDALRRRLATLAAQPEAAAIGSCLQLADWVFRRAALVGTPPPPGLDPERSRSRFGWQLMADLSGDVLWADERQNGNADRVWSTPFGTVPAAAGELSDWLHDLRGLREHPELLVAALAHTSGAFLDDLEQADPAEVGELAAFLAEVLSVLEAVAGGAGLRAIPAEERVRLWLVAHGHIVTMEQLTVDRWFQRPDVVTEVVEGRILGRFMAPEAAIDIPDAYRELPATHTRHLLGCRLADSGTGPGAPHVLRAVVAFDWIDDLSYPATHSAWAVPVGTTVQPIELVTRGVLDPAATRFIDRSFQRHHGDLIEIDVPTLPPGIWVIEVATHIASGSGGLEARGCFTTRERRGGAGDLTRLPGWSWDSSQGLRIDTSVAANLARDAPVADGKQPTVTEVTLGPDIVIAGHAPTHVAMGGLALRSGDLEIAASETTTLEPGPDGQPRFVARFPGTHDKWGLGATALPVGTWHLALSDDPSSHLAPAESLLNELPLDLPPGLGPAPGGSASGQSQPAEGLPRWRGRVLRGLRGQFLLRLTAPLGDDAAGRWAQQQLRTTYRAVATSGVTPVDPNLALFSSYAGTGATDSPRAIFDELHARRPDLTICWAVEDGSVAVPPGAQPVVLRSAEWYDVLARAGLVVSNVELERFYQPRPDQSVLQTFHGYPAKAMGLGLWRSKNFSPRRLERQLENTSGTWTWALTPTPTMDDYYRDNYRYDGTMWHDGYPRDDALVGDGAPARRSSARARLGIGEHQIAVLVAPTWRDDLATNYRSAQMAGHLDVDRLSELLGPQYVVLSRGHRFHAAGSSARRDAVVDVTGYPEVNDLILACDAAVLDYSSMRFDVALTGKPMVFCVPDLETYASDARGFLFPFVDSAPGPLVNSTDEVAQELRELDALRAQWAGALAEFNATFNDRNDGRAAVRVVDRLLG